MASDPKHSDAPGGGTAFPFTPQDALDFMQRMWNPLGIAMPGFPMAGAAAPQAPAGMPFAELRIIENWLTMSVNMMQMSIKTMELQKASLEAMRGSGRPDAK
jgi:hypothetical protein